MSKLIKGRSTQGNLANPYQAQHLGTDMIEGLDEELYQENIMTQYFLETPRKILSKNDSPDIPFTYSLNPYQGCEHGCVYCYARNSHLYWGFGAGLDFESKIVVKKNAPQLLEKAFLNPRWQPQVVILSGNTDCYQPAERKFKITRGLLSVMLRYGNPVGIITKNHLVLRDIDILSEMAGESLVKVYFSITSLSEDLRRVMEPRTSSAVNKLKVIEKLTSAGIPVGVMVGPVIPGLNDTEIHDIIRRSAEAGAIDAGYTAVRLNGQIGIFFEQWLERNFPDRKEKVMNLVKSMHNGNLNDSDWGRRMRGEGKIAEMIEKLFQSAVKKYFDPTHKAELRTDRFRRGGNLNLFD